MSRNITIKLTDTHTVLENAMKKNIKILKHMLEEAEKEYADYLKTKRPTKVVAAPVEEKVNVPSPIVEVVVKKEELPK